MKKTATILLAFTLFYSFNFAQKRHNIWIPLQNKEGRKIWYDASMLNNIKGNTFDVWIIEQHTPPLVFKEVKGKIYRSKTLYTLNLDLVKYGILKVVYFNSANKRLYDFNYPIKNFPDKYKYTYPITKNDVIFNLLKVYVKKKNKKKRKK